MLTKQRTWKNEAETTTTVVGIVPVDRISTTGEINHNCCASIRTATVAVVAASYDYDLNLIRMRATYRRLGGEVYFSCQQTGIEPPSYLDDDDDERETKALSEAY